MFAVSYHPNNMVFEMEHSVIRNPSWWMRRTNCERRLIILTLILSFSTIALFTTLTTILTRRSNLRRLATKVQLQQQQSTLICLTSTCNKTASILLENMNLSVSPCTDFYEFACGGFLAKTNIPDDEGSIDFFSTSDDGIKEQLRDIIEERPNSNEPQSLHLIRDIYQTCMNTTFIERQGLREMKKILRELGGWPVLDGEKWNELEFDWQETTYRMRKLGYKVDFVFEVAVWPDPKNTSRRVIGLQQASILIPEEQLYTKTAEAYYDYVVEVAVILGANRKYALRELKRSIAFEAQLAKILPTSKELRNPTALYNPMTIQQLQQNFPLIPWLEYIRNVINIPTISITNQEMIDVRAERYIGAALQLLQNTPKRDLANYFLWRIVASSIRYLTERMKHEEFLMFKAIHGYRRAQPRWRDCILDLTEKMNVALAALYARQYRERETIQGVSKLITHALVAFKEMVKRNRWLDEETRKYALRKTDAITKHSVYPNELFDDNKLEEYYSKLQLTSKDYLRTILDLSLFQMNYKFEQLRKPINKSEWVTHLLAIETQPYYVVTENSIKVSAGMLQKASFDPSRPYYMNYGVLGYLIGHHIIHGFDNKGRKFDKDGNLENWWTSDTENVFENKTQCIIDQYSQFSLPKTDLKVNGYHTHEENIADNGGLRVAYWAYKAFSEDNCPEPQLPGFQDYSPKQMFWISAANMWCEKARREEMKWEIENYEQSPNLFRVLGPFKNSEEFAQDFQCPLGSPMNPEKKCRVW